MQETVEESQLLQAWPWGLAWLRDVVPLLREFASEGTRFVVREAARRLTTRFCRSAEQLRRSRCVLTFLAKDLLELFCLTPDEDYVRLAQLVVEGYEPRYEIQIKDMTHMYPSDFSM